LRRGALPGPELPGTSSAGPSASSRIGNAGIVSTGAADRRLCAAEVLLRSSPSIPKLRMLLDWEHAVLLDTHMDEARHKGWAR
jgi:hypothetical protein